MSKRSKRKAPAGCFWRGGILYGRVQTGGQDIKWSLRTDDPVIAASRRKAERARVVASQRYGDHRRTFAEAMESWGKFIVNEVSAKTMARYASSLAVLQPQLEGLYLDEIDKKMIGEIVAIRRDTPTIPRGKKRPIKITVATIKRDLTALSSVLDHCVDEEWIEVNPVHLWLKPGRRRRARLRERRDPIILPEMEHIQMVIDRAPGLFGEMILAALKTGARLDELAKCQRPHFDKLRKQLTVIGKRNKLRVIDLQDNGEDFGLELFSSLPIALETKALFWHRKEGIAVPYRQVSSNFRRVVAAVAKQAQKQDQSFRPFRFHDLRHVHAVNWLKSGRSIYVLQKRLGHTSVKTTEAYLEYLTAAEAQIVKQGHEAEGSLSGASPAVRNNKSAN
jgi:integrase/recombinase XerD